MNLLEQGTLLLQHEFTLQKKHNSTKRQLFLFEDLLVFAKPRKIGAGRDQYLYKTSRKVTIVVVGGVDYSATRTRVMY